MVYTIISAKQLICGSFDCQVRASDLGLETEGFIPFCAVVQDAVGAVIHAQIMQAGDFEPYVAPPAPTAAEVTAAQHAKDSVRAETEHVMLRESLIKDCDPILRQYRNAAEFGLECNIDKDTAAKVAAYQNVLYDWHLGQPQPKTPDALTPKY
jgi:hypothetical protein